MYREGNDIVIKDQKIPLIGLGTTVFWYGNQSAEITMQKSIANGEIRMIDCAEMYGSGRCEKTAGRLMAGHHSQVYIIDKILPQNAIKAKFRKSFEQSCQRLQTDYIDLYLLHWRDDADLAFVAESMEQLKEEGRIGQWGVSNFDVSDMEDLFSVPYGKECFCDQILYNIGERGIEYDLLPWLKDHNVLPMAYSSLGSNWSDTRRMIRNNQIIVNICQKENITPEAFMLSFVLHQDIPAVFSTGNEEHLKANLKGLQFDVTPYIPLINELFSAPDHKVPLAKL